MTQSPTRELIEVRAAVFGYAGRPVVRVDDLRLNAGRCLGIFGPNGAGKTTLVRGITGLLPPMPPAGPAASRAAGRVRFPSEAVRFGYMPQHRAMELHWPMSGFDAAALATSARRPLGWVGAAARKSVLASMESLGVAALARRPFATLSGGQQQRLLLAGTLAAGPDVLVLDEPTDGLDVRSRQTLLDLLRDLTGKGLCTVIISHEVEDLLDLSHGIAWLHAADEAGEASHVEPISPEDFAARVLRVRGTP